MGVRRGAVPFAANAICKFGDPTHAIWWVAETFPLLWNLISGVKLVPTCSGVVLFAPVAVKKGEHCIWIKSKEAIGDFPVPVNKLVEVVLHVGKGAKFGVEEVNGGQNICSRDASVGNGKNFE